jgi:hypothetical protein
MKNSLSIAGIIMILALLASTVADPALAAPRAVGNPIRVAIYISTGANSDKIMATMRAVQAMGFEFYGIGRSDIKQGRLTTANYDVLLIPAGEADNKTAYASIDGLDQTLTKNNIKAFVNAGGGVVALESGAYYISLNGGTLDLYKATTPGARQPARPPSPFPTQASVPAPRKSTGPLAAATSPCPAARPRSPKTLPIRPSSRALPMARGGSSSVLLILSCAAIAN